MIGHPKIIVGLNLKGMGEGNGGGERRKSGEGRCLLLFQMYSVGILLTS